MSRIRVDYGSRQRAILLGTQVGPTEKVAKRPPARFILDGQIKRTLDVHDGLVCPKSKGSELPTLPIRASPSNIAHLCLARAVVLAINKPLRWEELLSQAVCEAEYYWDLAGARLDGPGRGTWRQTATSLNPDHPLQLRLINLINRLQAPPFPSTLSPTNVRFKNRGEGPANTIVNRRKGRSGHQAATHPVLPK
jgi:hypothetical protein